MGLKSKLRADIAQLKTTAKGNSLIVLFLTKKNFRIVILYRILNHYRKNKLVKLLLSPVALYYRLMTNKYCIDISISTEIGGGFKLNHAYGVVINQKTPIGENVYIGHNVTIGSNGVDRFPKIGNGVTISAGSLIIGDVTIGDNSIIGAGSLVVKDVPANAVIVGTPATVLKYLKPL